MLWGSLYRRPHTYKLLPGDNRSNDAVPPCTIPSPSNQMVYDVAGMLLPASCRRTTASLFMFRNYRGKFCPGVQEKVLSELVGPASVFNISICTLKYSRCR